MPIHDLGYRAARDTGTSNASRWSVIAGTGARRAWQSTWVRRILFFAWLPLLLFGFAFVVFERAAHGDETSLMWSMGMVQTFAPELLDEVSGGPAGLSPQDMHAIRHGFWVRVLQLYFRYPQGIAMILLIGLIAPRLISEDVETRAFLFYFSRPLGRLEYLLGKSATVWVFMAGITTIPALCMYFLGILLSPEFSVVADTWDIPLRILAASITLIVPATALAMCFSSLTKESRYAGFAWFAIWILGFVAFLFLTAWRINSEGLPQGNQWERVIAHADRQGDRDGLASREELEAILNPSPGNFIGLGNPAGSGQVEELMAMDANGDGKLGRHEVNPDEPKFEEYFSPYQVFGQVQAWVFGRVSFGRVKWFVVLLTFQTIVCLLVLFRRVSAPMRA